MLNIRHLRLIVLSVVVCLMAGTLSGCGWRVRGSDSGSSLTIKTALAGVQHTVYREIEKNLQRRDILVSASEAAIVLTLAEEKWQRRSVSVSNSALAAEYQLTLNVAYSVTSQDHQPITARTARLARSYTFDQNDAVGKDREERLLRKEMQRDIARQIQRQVSAVAARQ